MGGMGWIAEYSDQPVQRRYTGRMGHPKNETSPSYNPERYRAYGRCQRMQGPTIQIAGKTAQHRMPKMGGGDMP